MSNSCYLSCNLPFVNSTKGAQTILSYGLRITLFVLGVLAAASGIYVLAGLSHTSIVGYSLLAGGACTAFLSSILKCVRPEAKIEEPPLLVIEEPPLLVEVPANPIIPFERVDALSPEVWGIIFGELENDDALLSVARLCRSHAQIVKSDQNLSRRLLSYQLREQALEIWKEKVIVEHNYFIYFKKILPHLVQQHLPRLIEILEYFLHNLQQPKKRASEAQLYLYAMDLFLNLPLEKHPKKTIFLEQIIKSAKCEEDLSSCVRCLVKYDLERSKKIAGSILNNLYKDRAWAHIAKHQATYDFSQAIASLNQISSILEKKWYLPDVLEIAYQNKTVILPEILEALWEECRAQNDLNESLSVSFALAFRATKNNQKVFEILDSFTTRGWEWQRGNLISIMAQKVDCTDVDDIAFLEGLYKRAMNHTNKCNLAIFAVIFGRIDHQRGLALLDEIQRFIKQSSVSDPCWDYFTPLALCYCYFDIEKAIQLMNEHPKVKAKISHLIDLANHLRLHAPKRAVSLLEEAYDHALKENMDIYVFKLICRIARVYAHLNRERASEILIGLGPELNQGIRRPVFVAVYLKACTLIDLNKAFSLIIPIQEPIMKARGYMKMAKVIDEFGF
jgi:hypothetical protein